MATGVRMRINVLVAPALLLAALTLAACDAGASGTAHVTSEAATRSPQPSATRSATSPVCQAPYPTSEPRIFCIDPARYASATVTRVVDGDTIHVRIGGSEEIVRFFGIDTPERGDRCAAEATARTRALTADGVVLRPDARERDPYDRLLRYVYTPAGLSVDATLIADGLAHAWTRDGTLRDDLIDIEREARDAHRGCLWK